MGKVKTSLVLFILAIFCFLSFPTSTQASTILFQDNFSSGYSKWVYSGTSGWTVSSGRYGMHMTSGLSDTFPSNDFWQTSWRNIKFEVVLHGVRGTDKNIILRYVNGSNFYGIHHSGGIMYFEKIVNGNGYNVAGPVSFALVNDRDYFITCEIFEKRIKVYIDGEIIFNFEDQAPYIEEGKPGLRIGTGAVSPTEVWFDNVVVTSLDPEPTAIPTATPTATPTMTPTATPTPANITVLVPGMGASFNFKELLLKQSNPDGWRMIPGVNIYDNIHQAYFGDPNYYVFYYDWTKPTLDIGQQLDDYINARLPSSGSKVNLIGHSLGGLVARACIEKSTDNCHINKFVSVGTPFKGSTDAYPAVAGGEIWRTGLQKLAVSILLHYHQTPGETDKDTLNRLLPTMKNILPTYQFLKRNGTLLPLSASSYQNDLVPQLLAPATMAPYAHLVYSTGLSTARYINLTTRSWLDNLLGLWPDGKPSSVDRDTEGDKSILVLSAVPDSTPPKYEYQNIAHGDLIFNEQTVPKIAEILGKTIAAEDLIVITEPDNYLIYMAHSPVKLASLEPTTYLQEDELVIIPNPTDKDYQLNVIGLANDYYTLSVGLVKGENVYWHDYYDKAVTGQTKSLTFRVDLTDPSKNPLLDTGGTVSGNQLSNRIEEFRSEINDLTISRANKQNLNSLLDQIMLTAGRKQLEKAMDYLFQLRKSLTLLAKRFEINSTLANLFRAKSAFIQTELDKIAEANRATTPKQTAQSYVKLAEAEKTKINYLKKLTKNGGLVFTEADNRLTSAKSRIAAGEYYLGKFQAMSALALFTESVLVP